LLNFSERATELALVATVSLDRYQLYLDINKPLYEMLRLQDGCVPVIGKVYYRMFDIQEKINNFMDIAIQQ